MTILAAELGGAQRCKGVDVSTKAIATSRNARIAKGTVEFEVATEDQWGVDKFDTVLCVDVLHHVPRASREKFVANLCAAARPGGVVLFKDISPRPRWKYMANCLHDLIMAHQRVSCAPPETVRGWLEAAGMTIREQTPMHRLWYSHYLIVAEKPNSQNKGVDRAA
jgi:2-polyprenyl-3-methyl-5-hydroxy-6-metoxy-1,4-benzoquinol methylase